MPETIIHLPTKEASDFIHADAMRRDTELIENLARYGFTVESLISLCAVHQNVDHIQLTQGFSGPLFMALDCINWVALNLCACRGYGCKGKLEDAIKHLERANEEGVLHGK